MSCIPKDAPLHSCLHQQAGEQDLTREWGWGLIPAMISFSLVLSTFRCQNPAPIPPGEGLWGECEVGQCGPWTKCSWCPPASLSFPLHFSPGNSQIPRACPRVCLLCSHRSVCCAPVFITPGPDFHSIAGK